MQRLALTAGHLGSAIGQQVVDSEGIGMSLVGVQRQEQRRPLLHNADARVPMAMDATLVALGPAEPALQLQVVLRQFRPITADDAERVVALSETYRAEVRYSSGVVRTQKIVVGNVPLRVTVNDRTPKGDAWTRLQ